VNDIIGREFSDEIEFAWIEEQVVDQKIQAEVLSTYVANGIMSINQAREKLGEEPDADPSASTLMVKTATGFFARRTTAKRKMTHGRVHTRRFACLA